MGSHRHASREYAWLVSGLVAFVACAKRPPIDRIPVAEWLGYGPNARLLVIHADDLGMSHAVDRATFEAIENHWVTSASILVPCPWFPEVVKFAREHPQADLGIHLALNSEWTAIRWGPVAPADRVPSLLDADGYLPLLATEVVAKARVREAETELRAQIERARAAGIAFSHFDSHMATLVGSPDLFSTFSKLGDRYQVPIRLSSRPNFPGVELTPRAMLIDAAFQVDPSVPPDQWLSWYEKTLASLPPGSYQLTVHLGFDDEEMRGATFDHPNWGAAWRQRDFDTVRNPEFQRFVKEQGFVLVSWRDLGRALAQGEAPPQAGPKARAE